MDKNAELEERLGRVQALRQERWSLKRQVKDLNTERKGVEEQIDGLLDEIKDIRDGGGVQETLTAKERDTVQNLDRKLKRHGASLTIKGPDGAGVTIGATGAK